MTRKIGFSTDTNVFHYGYPICGVRKGPDSVQRCILRYGHPYAAHKHVTSFDHDGYVFITGQNDFYFRKDFQPILFPEFNPYLIHYARYSPARGEAEKIFTSKQAIFNWLVTQIDTSLLTYPHFKIFYEKYSLLSEEELKLPDPKYIDLEYYNSLMIYVKNRVKQFLEP